MDGGDAADPRVPGDHGQIARQSDQVLEVYDIGSYFSDFLAKGRGDGRGKEVIAELTASSVVDHAGDSQIVDDLLKDIPIAALGVTMAGENADRMAFSVQNPRQSLGVGLHPAKGAWRVAVAYLKNPHGISSRCALRSL